MQHNESTKRQIKIKNVTFLKRLPFFISILAVLAVLYDFGFNHQPLEKDIIQIIYLVAVFTGSISIISRYFFRTSRPRIKVLPFDLLLVLYLISVILAKSEIPESLFAFFHFLKKPVFLYAAIFFIFIRESSAVQYNFKRALINPAQLFIFSFLMLIIIGGVLLMLPRATHTSISLLDALFTSTSAVCVTGLVVVDTGSFFTEFGQVIIAVLIQLGGLGIMTFTSYFSYFFKGRSSYGDQLMLREMSNSEKIGEVFDTLKKIILVTCFIEAAGALFLFQSIDVAVIPKFSDRLFFSVFHSISGFCNAGFSTLPNGLFERTFQLNYPLHLIIAALIILGGIGFPIVFNLLKYFIIQLKNIYLRFIRKKQPIRLPWIININTRIVLVSSLILTVFGMVLFYIFEYNNTLSGNSFFGKIVTAFFSAVTPRTAGFNTVDISALSLPTIFILLFLMWVGASPGSTGGGIKTSTLAIAFLNIFSLARGKSRIEIYRREIAQTSVNRAFSIIVLSIVAIGLSIFFMTLFDIEKGLLNITFECVSAFSTVGLSRGITAELSNPGKFILILTMFIGRVSMLNILIAISKKNPPVKYRYPTEEILIN